MGNIYSPYSWAREIVPELLWIGLLHRGLGLRKGIEFSSQLALAADRAYHKDIKPLFCKITSFGLLDEAQKQSVLTEIAALGDFKAAKKALSSLFSLAPKSPLAFLADDSSNIDQVAETRGLSDLLPKLYDRHSREAVHTIATAVNIGFGQNKIFIAQHLADKMSKDFAVIDQYPDTDESRAAGSSFRAMAPMLFLNKEDPTADLHADWLEYFWDQVSGFGACVLEVELTEAELEPDDELGKIVVRFRNSARKAMRERIEKWHFDLNEIEQYEVIGALIARQTTLAMELAGSPGIWTAHSAPLFLRAMADVFIALAWIFKDPQVRAQKFIDDGLGAIKLQIEHRKRELEKGEDDNPGARKMLEHMQEWLSAQRMDALVEVNLGSWSNLNTRMMAEEANCLDFYNYVYQPFSAAVHSNWPHVSQKNMLYCINPAHRFHRIAVNVDLKPDLEYLILAARYLDKAFKKFDDETGVEVKSPSPYAELMGDLKSDSAED